MRVRQLVPVLGLVACKGEIVLADAEELAAYCEDATTEQVTYTIDFGEVGPGCAWGEDGNGEPTQGVMSARFELEEVLDVGEDNIICGVDLDFSGMSSDEVRYDDHFFLTFAGGVIATSNGTFIEHLDEDDNSIPVWDWDNIVGTEMPVSERGWCLNSWGDGGTDCEIPESDQLGELTIDFDDDAVERMGYRAWEEQTVSFGLVTTGDNDDSDCYLSDMSFEVTFDEA